ncbi:MAG: hypothetical protein AAFR46_11810, partial [Pseudomonadota bacterium]
AYLSTLLRYWEEEVEGEAYFRALADQLSDRQQKEKMTLLAEVERHTAAITRPLIEKYGLVPQPESALAAAGREAAADAPGWEALLAEMRASYPGYISAFEALAALAPAADRPLLDRMTEHEVVALAFLEAETQGALDSTAPLLSFLSTPVATSQAA